MSSKSFVKYSLFAFLLLSIFMVACSDDASSETTEEFVSESIEVLNRSSMAGAGGCFEFVFPISIMFEDGTSVEVDSYEDLRTAIKAWRESNPDAKKRPNLEFPLEVINSEGELISVTGRDELKTLIRECKSEMTNGQHKRCFKIVYPVSILFPDGSSLEVEDRKAAKEALRAWKAENPDATERPALDFPIDVELEDGTIQTINSKEELIALKEECRG